MHSIGAACLLFDRTPATIVSPSCYCYVCCVSFHRLGYWRN